MNKGDKMKDGLALMYIKDNIVYPVALTKKQLEVFEIIQQMLPQPIKVIENYPMGEVYNLLDEKLQRR